VGWEKIHMLRKKFLSGGLPKVTLPNHKAKKNKKQHSKTKKQKMEGRTEKACQHARVQPISGSWRSLVDKAKAGKKGKRIWRGKAE